VFGFQLLFKSRLAAITPVIVPDNDSDHRGIVYEDEWQGERFTAWPIRLAEPCCKRGCSQSRPSGRTRQPSSVDSPPKGCGYLW